MDAILAQEGFINGFRDNLAFRPAGLDRDPDLTDPPLLDAQVH